MANGFRELLPSRPDCDTDGDGFSNLEEQLAYTDPSDDLSHP